MLWSSGQAILADRAARQATWLFSNLNGKAATVLEVHFRNSLFFIAWLAIFLTIQQLPPNSTHIARQSAAGFQFAGTSGNADRGAMTGGR